MNHAEWHRRVDLIARRDLLRANAAGSRRQAETFDQQADAINAELNAEVGPQSTTYEIKGVRLVDLMEDLHRRNERRNGGGAA